MNLKKPNLASVSDPSQLAGHLVDMYQAIVDLDKGSKIAALSILGNASSGLSLPSSLTPAQVTAMLALFTATLQGLVPPSGGGTANFLRADVTWAAPPAPATPGRLLRAVRLTGTSLVVTAGTTRAIIDLWGGGGQGGGAVGGAQDAGGGGGAGSKSRLVTTNIPATWNFVLGAGGSSGGTGANGQNGANSTFTDSAITMTAPGGAGGQVGGIPGAGGAAGVNTTVAGGGAPGHAGLFTGFTFWGAAGGSSEFGGGGAYRIGVDGNGGAATGFGAGGGGALSGGVGTAYSGGVGTGGTGFLWEFSS